MTDASTSSAALAEMTDVNSHAAVRPHPADAPRPADVGRGVIAAAHTTATGLARRTPRRVQAVDHAIDVMECIAASGTALGISEIARSTSLSKAAVHHLLATLVARRFVIQEPESSHYRLGWNLYELGSSVIHSVSISRVSRVYLDRLAVQTETTSLLAIRDGDSVLYLDRGEAPTVLRTAADAGRRSPLHATASGKVLLAYTDPRVLDRLSRSPLPALTPATITDPDALRVQLADVRRNGYAVCWQEREAGLSSISVPLRNYTGAVIGALTLAATSVRLCQATFRDYLTPLKRAADQIDRHLGAECERSIDGEPDTASA